MTAAALEPDAFADVRDKLAAIIDALPTGAHIDAEHADVRALVAAGQVPPQWIGQAFAALAGRRHAPIRRIGFRAATRAASKGHLIRVWEVTA